MGEGVTSPGKAPTVVLTALRSVLDTEPQHPHAGSSIPRPLSHTGEGGPALFIHPQNNPSPEGAGNPQLRVAKQVKPLRLSARQASCAASASEKPEKRAR